MKTPDIGSVIQVREDIPVWGGCLMIVDKAAQWGVQAYMRLPGKEVQTTALRLTHGDYYPIGKAEVVQDEKA